MLLRVLSTTENQETQELLDEIQQQPGVFVLSGPDVVTASEFLADGWSTESVKPCRERSKDKTRTHKKERAEHAYYSYIHDEMTTFDTFPVTVLGLDEGEHPQKS